MAANDSARGRRESVGVRVGAIRIGGGAPVVVQSMTDTADARATAEQVKALADAGSEIVRITVDTPKAAAAVPTIRERLEAAGCHVPLVGDFTLQRSLAAHRIPGLCRSPGQVPDQSGQCRVSRETRHAVPNHDRGRAHP